LRDDCSFNTSIWKAKEILTTQIKILIRRWKGRAEIDHTINDDDDDDDSPRPSVHPINDDDHTKVNTVNKQIMKKL
jgi:hypothetical protein